MTEKELLEEVRLDIPILPNRALSPNASWKMHWGTKAKHKTDLQVAVSGAMFQFGNWLRREQKIFVIFENATINIDIHCWDKRKFMDRDNTIAALKHGFDVLQARVIANDKDLRIGHVEWHKSLRQGMVWTIKLLKEGL